MPASKRSSESHSPQAKMMKLEVDDEATPGEYNSSLKAEDEHEGAEDAHEGTVPPWTKNKDPPTAKEEDEEVASFLQEFKPSPRQNDSDPPLKKAKLFIATSASSGTGSPQSIESKSSQKRPASTELSRTASSDSDGETQTDAGDLSLCVTKHHNRAKRAATEMLVDQSAARQTLDDGRPPYPTVMDHNYGRSSEGSSDSSVLDESANTETEVNVSSATDAETTQYINSTSLPLLQAMPYSVIQSTHPAVEARRHEGEESTRSTAEAGSSTEHVNSRPSAKHEEHKTEDSSERTSREPDSQNHIDGKILEPPPPAETSDPSSSDRNLNVIAEVNMFASQSEERCGGLVELEVITYEAEETQDPAPEDLKQEIPYKREAEERKQQDVTERTAVTEAAKKTGIEFGPSSNQNDQEQAIASPSEGSLTPARTLGPQETKDEAQIKTEKTPKAEPILPDPTEPGREETLANCCGVHQVAENLGSPPGIQADLAEEIRIVPVAEESIAAPESAAEVQLVHGVQEPDDRTVSSSSEVLVTNSEEHVGRTVYERVTVQEPEITSNLGSATSSQGMCEVAPAEDTQPEVMQSVHTSTSTYSGVSAQLTLTNPDSRQTEYECVSECVTVQETPNLVSTTTDTPPTEKLEPDGTQHLDVTPGTSRDGPELLPDTYSGVIADCVDGGEVQPQVTLSSSTANLGEKTNEVISEATMEEEVSLKVDDDSAVPGVSSHGPDHMVVQPLNSEAQDNANVESTATLVITSTLPTPGMLHFEEASTDLSISTTVPSVNENNEVVFECLAETSVNMYSTATDDQIHGHAQVIMEGVLHRETHSADNGSVDVDTRVSQQVRMNAVSKEGETIISEYVHEQKTGMNRMSKEISLTAPSDKLADKEIQRFNDDYTGMSSEAPKHLTLSTSDCAPYMEMTETKPHLFNQALENENQEQEEQSTGTSKDGASQLIKYEMVAQSIPVQSPEMAAMSMTVPSQQVATPFPNKEIQTQKEVMAIMDKHLLIANSQGNLNQGKSFEDVITTESKAAPEAESYEVMHTTSTPEEMHEQEKKGRGGEPGNHSGIEHTPTYDKEEEADKYDKMAADLQTATTDGVPNFITAAEQQIQVFHEEPIAAVNNVEEGYLISNAELLDKDSTTEAVAYVTSGDKEETTSVEEKSHSVREDLQEGAGCVIDEVEVNASLSSTIGQGQAQVNSDVIVLVCDQPEGLEVVESSTVNKPDAEDVTEQMETVFQSEGEPKDFQVVYEAISSPESTIDEEVGVVSGIIRIPNVSKKDTQVVEVHSAAISATSEVNVRLIPVQEADEHINGKTPACLPDSQSDMDNIETMTCEETAESSYVLPIEHTNGAADMGDVLMVATSDEVAEPNIQKTEAMADVLEITSDNVPEPNIHTTEAMAEVLEETTSKDIKEQNILNREQRLEGLMVTTGNEVPRQNLLTTEERREVPVLTTSDGVSEPRFQKYKEIGEVLVVATIDHIPEINIQNTEEMGEVPIVTTSDKVPEQNIQHAEEIVDVFVETTSNHIPEQSFQKTVKMAEALVVADSEKIPERNIQKTEGMGGVLVVATCDNILEQTMQQTEGMGDVLGVTTCDDMPEPTIEQMEGAPESVEMQKDNRLQELSQVTPIATSMAPSEPTPDSLSQEDVMESLTVPESPDQADIITQAAAASGLNTSLSEHLNSDGQMVEADQVLNLNGASQSLYSAIGVHQYQPMEQSTVTGSNEEAREDMEVRSSTNTSPVALLENYIPSAPNPDQQEEQSAEKNLDATEHDMEPSAVCETQMTAYENASVDMTRGVETSMDNADSDMQILVDIELGHQVEVQDESEMEDPDLVIIEKSQLAAEMPSLEVENGGEKSPIIKADSTSTIADGTTSKITTSSTDKSVQKAEETNKTSTPSIIPDPKAEVTVEKPKKQQMNTQARTKARLAALAEQKAAASKRAAQKQQLNLLALCEEIAEDIATDSMLLKRIEEEKIAAAAKIEALKKESRSVEMQEAIVVPPTPAGSQASSTPVNTTDGAEAAKPTTATTINPPAEPATAKPVVPEPPKRRFFVSQIVVPLKAHEKKKLTRYQRLRQVELQREKMSWTRVKKLKTDQAHQMLFSDIDFDSSNPFLMPPVATPSTPIANKPSATYTSTASTSASTISALPAMPQVPDAAVAKPDQSKTPEQSKAVTTPDLPLVVTTPDPSKVVATPEPSKADQKVTATKTDQKVTATPARPGRPRREAASPKVDPAKVVSSKVETKKTEPPKITSAKGPTPKVTRSSTRKTLPAKPPPMPNGMNSQKAKSEVEYKPYRPRPKYTFEDFELDDDPPPVVQRRPMPQQRPGQQPGPSQQSTSNTQVRPTSQSTNPTAQSRTTPPSRPMFFSQSKLQGTPVRQASSQSKPVTSTPVMLKPTTSTPVQSRPAISSTVQSKPLTTTASQSKPVAITTSQSKPTTSATGQLKPATSNASQSKPMTPTGQSRPVTYKAPQLKPFHSTVAQSKPSIAAAPQSKTTIAAATQPISAVPSKPTLKVSDTVGSVPGKAIPSGPPAPQTPQPTADQAPKPQPGSPKEELEVKPAVETPLLLPAIPQPNVSMETLSVQPPAIPHNVKHQDSTDEVSPPPPSSLPPPQKQQTSSNMMEPKEEKAEVKSPPPSPMKASPPDEQAEASKPAEKTPAQPSEQVAKAESNTTPLSEAALQKEVKKLKDTDKDGSQTIIDAGQKHFGAVACSVCGMLYSASNPEDETQHILFHNQFISAVKYVGWKKERILGEYPDGKIILVLPDDPKYALKKVEEIREMVDNDLGFQQVETKCPSQTKTFLFISNDKKVAGCLIAEHIQEGYRVIEDPPPQGSEKEQVMFERQRAWCCSSTSEPAICGISRIWVFSMMRRQGIASRMIECLRNNFIYGSCLGKDELAFSDPTPDGKLFATRYFGTSRFLVYNFVSGTSSSEPKTAAV
ncbi:mucin-17-like isoform X2 [Gadus macrocephalus]|uniref:mucin-17-like isoform X2 n=1 Tax=Gadus macrocephalus TaxID=80720 RepID=UPI0028CB2D5E|nr:mucin-17-like isoform X2 [Gadus macrocephalus]